jgi:hypothetical protein
MAVIANSKPSPTSEDGTRAVNRGSAAVAAAAGCAALLSAAAVWFCWRQGWSLYYGDAESHLNIARRIIDSRTPGYGQLGTGWLPLLHLLILPFAAHDRLWITGLAGSIPPATCFVLGLTFFFAAVRRALESTTAAGVAAALYAFNPNTLYLQSIPMTEMVFFGALAATLYFTVRFHQTQSLASAAGAGIALFAGTLTRYEAWFLIPFVTAYFLFGSRRRGFRAALVFGAMASLGPLLWLGYNRLVFANVWEFYSGPASAKAIQGGRPYAGHNDWKLALIYFGWAARACAGAPLFFIGAAGAVAAIWRRAFWPFILLALPGVFYVWSIHSADSPIHLPNLWPHSYYNTRYGLAVLPCLAFGGAAIVAVINRIVTVGSRQRLYATSLTAVVLLAAATSPWVLDPHPESCITWKESQQNSIARRAWTKKAADFLAAGYHRGDGVITSFGDYTAIFRTAGIPLRDTLTGDNGLAWQAAVLRPELFLWEQWAVVTGGDPVQTAINRARRHGPNFDLVRQIIVKRADVLEIYERDTAPSNLVHPTDADSIP